RDRFLDDETLRGDAALTVVLVTRSNRRSHRGIDVSVGQNNERIGPAQLEDLFLEVTASSARHPLANIAGPGQGDSGNATVSDQRLHFRARHQHGTKEPGG